MFGAGARNWRLTQPQTLRVSAASRSPCRTQRLSVSREQPISAAMSALRAAKSPEPTDSHRVPPSRSRSCRRMTHFGRAQVLSQQPAAPHVPARLGRRHQGALGLRAGAPAAQGRVGAGPLRGPVLDRPAPARPDVLHRLRLPATPAPRRTGPGENAPPVPGPPPSPSLPAVRRAIISKLFAPTIPRPVPLLQAPVPAIL